MGLLRIQGTIDVAQFWPNGEADADTTKVKVNVDPNSFAYATDGQNFKPTTVFNDAKVIGTTREAVIRSGRVTVRLQGIDAPELHYRAGALRRSDEISDAEREAFNTMNRVSRRQYWAETATIALKSKLSNFDNATVPCEVISRIEYPHELVDTYGRVVANIYIGANFSTDINLWLTEEGWTVPAFYSSMSSDEINDQLAAMKKGKKKNRVISAITPKTTRFDEKLLYRRHGEPDEEADMGDVLMPKLFRRQVSYVLQKKAGIVSGTFKKFLAQSPDYCFTLEDFLAMGVHAAPPTTIDQFMSGSKFGLDPHELIFKEKFSTVVDPSGNRIEAF